MDQPVIIDSDSMKYYKLIHRLIVKGFSINDPNNERYEKLLKIYYDIGDMLSKPEVLNNHEKLAEYDRYHIEFYESNDFKLDSNEDWMNALDFL